MRISRHRAMKMRCYTCVNKDIEYQSTDGSVFCKGGYEACLQMLSNRGKEQKIGGATIESAKQEDRMKQDPSTYGTYDISEEAMKDIVETVFDKIKREDEEAAKLEPKRKKAPMGEWIQVDDQMALDGRRWVATHAMKVTGGWLVNNEFNMCFLPDPQHHMEYWWGMDDD